MNTDYLLKSVYILIIPEYPYGYGLFEENRINTDFSHTQKLKSCNLLQLIPALFAYQFWSNFLIISLIKQVQEHIVQGFVVYKCVLMVFWTYLCTWSQMVKACVVKKPNVEKTIANDDKKSMEGLHPLFKSVASLSGVGKAIVTHENFALTDESCAIFGWFQSKMMGSSAKFEGKSFEDVFADFGAQPNAERNLFFPTCWKNATTVLF